MKKLSTALESAKELVQQGICCIPLINGEVAYVDPEDWVRLDRTEWRRDVKNKNMRVRRLRYKGKKQITVFMHRLVSNTPRYEQCHHINGNPLDNRKANLSNKSWHEHKVLHMKGGKKLLSSKSERGLLISEAVRRGFTFLATDQGSTKRQGQLF